VGAGRDASSGGGIGCIQAGEGKTLMGLLMPMMMPDCKHAVLLLPAGLKRSYSIGIGDLFQIMEST